MAKYICPKCKTVVHEDEHGFCCRDCLFKKGENVELKLAPGEEHPLDSYEKMDEDAQKRYMDRHERREQVRKNATDCARLLAEGVNSIGGNNDFEKAFIETMVLKTHRTLQQSSAGLLLRLFKTWAELHPHLYDGRNEATVNLAKKVIEATKDDYLPLV